MQEKEKPEPGLTLLKSFNTKLMDLVSEKITVRAEEWKGWEHIIVT